MELLGGDSNWKENAIGKDRGLGMVIKGLETGEESYTSNMKHIPI